MGVQRLVAMLPALGPGNPLDNLKAFGDDVLAKLG